MSQNKNILVLYEEKKIADLSKTDLKAPIDEKRNTILHKIASNLDQKTLEELHQLNPQSVKIAINVQNTEGNTPLHTALESIKTQDSNKYSIIKYMIKTLGADPSVENKKGLIIAGPSTSDSDENITSPPHPQTLCKSWGKSTELPPKTSPEVIDFIRRLTSHYGSGKNVQSVQSAQIKAKGGAQSYSGRRMIGALSPENQPENKIRRYNISASSSNEDPILESSEDIVESGMNDSFNIKSGKKLLEDFSYLISPQDGGRRDPVVLAKYNQILKRIMELLDIDEETARTYRSMIKLNITNEHPELRGAVNDSLKIAEIEKIVADESKLRAYWEQKVKPNIPMIKARMEEQAKLGEERRKAREANGPREPKKFNRDRPNKKPKDTDTSVSGSTSASESDSEPKAKTKTKKTVEKKTKEPAEKKKGTTVKKESTKKATKKSTKKATESGYIRSDERIFDSEY